MGVKRYEITVAPALVIGLMGLLLAITVNALLFAYMQGMFSGIPPGEAVPIQPGFPVAFLMLGIGTTFFGFIGGIGICACIEAQHAKKQQPLPLA